MNRSKLNYKIYNGKNLKALLEHKRTLILSLFFSAGILIGAMMLNKESLVTDNIYECLFKKTEQGISDVFINSLLTNGAFFSLNIFFAFSLIGYSLIMWLPFLKGLGTGVVIGYLYSAYGFSGFGYSVLTLLPGATVSTYALIFSCNLSCDYSENAYSKAIIGKGQFEKGETKYFLLKQFVYICLCVASSLVDAVFSNIFLRFFEL